MRSWIRTAALSLGLLVFAAGAGIAGSEWQGVWKVADTAGQPFEITLGADGSAKASLHEDMVGTWTAEGDSAVIHWKTGWTTVISKGETGYRKAGFREGASLAGAPTNSSSAVKVK